MKLKVYNKLTGEIRDVVGVFGKKYSFVPTSNRIEHFDAEMSDCVLMMGSGVMDVNGEEIFSGHEVEFLHKESGNVIVGAVVAMYGWGKWDFYANFGRLGPWKLDGHDAYYYKDEKVNSDMKIIMVGYEK